MGKLDRSMAQFAANCAWGKARRYRTRKCALTQGASGHSENRQIAVDKSTVTSSPQYSVRSFELRRNIKEIDENIANQFDCVKTKSKSNVCKKRQYRFLVGVRLNVRLGQLAIARTEGRDD